MDEFWSETPIFTDPYFVGVVLIIGQSLFTTAYPFLENYIKTKNPVFNKILSLSGMVMWLIIISLLTYYSHQPSKPLLFIVLMMITTTMIFCYSIWRSLNQFWQLGIVGTDLDTASGINYHKSLKLCQFSLSFLGIGASKLTSNNDFEKALFRCRQSKPIRFLLLDPTNENLFSAAKRAAKGEKRYQELVCESLKIIKNLKENRELDIQVRFYTEKPLFRLMFIDDSLCLVGAYNELGVSDGSNSPQIHLRNSRNHQHSKALYNSFEAYYENLWESSRPINFDTDVR